MANYGSISFSNSGLSEAAASMAGFYESYKTAVKGLEEQVAAVTANWTGDESGVMAAFQGKVTAMKTTLTEMEQLLNTAQSTLKAKSDEFAAASAKAASFFK